MSRLEAVKALVAQDPANSRVRYMLSMEYMSARDFGAAVAELKELLARDADYVSAYYQAGRASEEAGEEDAARGYYREGIVTAKRVGDAHALSELQAALDIIGDF